MPLIVPYGATSAPLLREQARGSEIQKTAPDIGAVFDY